MTINSSSIVLFVNIVQFLIHLLRLLHSQFNITNRMNQIRILPITNITQEHFPDTMIVHSFVFGQLNMRHLGNYVGTIADFTDPAIRPKFGNGRLPDVHPQIAAVNLS